MKRFTASKYNPEEWADLFKRAGAGYAVLTAKHHDGFALWDTAESSLNAVNTPAGKDLIKPYCDAMREAGLKTGLYFSHLDWSHPDYVPVPVEKRTRLTVRDHPDSSWSEGPDTPAWKRFRNFHRAQLKELCSNFGKIDLLWFDGDWSPAGNDFWRFDELRSDLHSWSPRIVLNSRMGGYGDYATPEQGFPQVAPEGPWEYNVTVNNSWGYQPKDDNHKPLELLVRMFCECLNMGGNMLLDIGPYEDGSFQPEQVKRLEGLGRWIAKNREAVYSTVAGLPPGHVYGASTLSENHETLYLYLFDRPRNVSVKGIYNTVKSVSVVSSGKNLTHKKIGGASWGDVPGIIWINIPEDVVEYCDLVLKIELIGTLELYTGRKSDKTIENKQLSIRSTIGDLLDNPASKGVLEKYLGDLVNSKEAEHGRFFPLTIVREEMPHLINEETLALLDEELRKIRI